MKQREITIETRPLREACAMLAKLNAPKRATLPVLGYALLTPPAGKDEPGTLACNTLDEAMRVNLAMKAGKQAKPCLVPFALLRRAAAGATEMGAVSVLADPGKRPPVVAWDAGYASMEEGYDPMDVDDFPPLPGTPAAWLEAGDLLANYARCMPFASTDERRIVLTGPAFFPAWQVDPTSKTPPADQRPPSCMPGAHMVSTDGRRIEARPVTGCGLDRSVIIRPSDALLALANLPPGKAGFVPGDAGYAVTLALQVGSVTHWSRTIDGTYPNWRQVIPNEPGKTVWEPMPDECKALAKILRALPSSSQHVPTITLTPGKDGQPAMAVCKSGTGTARLTLTAFTGESHCPFRLEFMLQAITEGPVRVTITDDLSPARLDGPSRVHVLMPMRLP